MEAPPVNRSQLNSARLYVSPTLSPVPKFVKKFPLVYAGRQVEKRRFPFRKPTAYITLPCATALACDAWPHGYGNMLQNKHRIACDRHKIKWMVLLTWKYYALSAISIQSLIVDAHTRNILRHDKCTQSVASSSLAWLPKSEWRALELPAYFPSSLLLTSLCVLTCMNSL